jgi:hypothetical protein
MGANRTIPVRFSQLIALASALLVATVTATPQPCPSGLQCASGPSVPQVGGVHIYLDGLMGLTVQSLPDSKGARLASQEVGQWYSRLQHIAT